ncbi:hypothetical protein [Desulfocicer vacuolatum]|uniref:hypothetical protein n=1 Tax=Desulfocicer vacuolatum TaxID=2298 RepID=UPI00111BE6B9|nr:hypothetical protein [Desulfocicer vacuolatum]
MFDGFQNVVPYGADLAVADVNDDGYDDVIVTVDNWHLNPYSNDIGYADGTELYVYKKVREDQGVSPYMLASGTYDTRVAVGNIDNDPYDEIVLVSSQSTDNYPNYKKVVEIWDVVTGPDYFYHKKWKGWDLKWYPSTQGQQVGLAVGDFNNDHIDEFAFGMPCNNESMVQVQSYQYDATSKDFITYEDFNIDVNYPVHQNISHVKLATGDFDGNGAEELTVSFLQIDDSSQNFFSHTWFFFSHAFTNYEIYPDQNKTMYIVDIGYDSIASSGAQISTGDVDADGMDEIIIAVNSSHDIQWKQYDLKKKIDGPSWEFEQTRSSNINHSNYIKSGDYSSSGSFMTLGDFDGDSLKVKYTDEHWVHMIDPVITTVLVAPPVEFGIPQAYHHTHVTYGKISENTVEEGTTYETSIAAGISAEAEFLDLIKASAKTGFEHEYKSTDATAIRKEKVTSFTGDCYGNYVIFLGAAFHSYKYEIIASPDQKIVKTYMTIDVPVGSGYWKWEVNYFNDNNGNAPDIGIETMSNIPGQITSYPRPSDRDAIMIHNETNGSFNATTIGGSTVQHVNQGISGNTSVGLTISNEVSHEEEKSWGIEAEGEFSVCGIGGWVSTSIKDGSLIKFTYSEGTEYEGGVGDIITCFNEDGSAGCYKASLVEDSESYEENYPYWNSYYYNWGMFVYNLSRPDENVKYNVVNFWVDGLGPAYDGS